MGLSPGVLIAPLVSFSGAYGKFSGEFSGYL